jgi:hypothetical protein
MKAKMDPEKGIILAFFWFWDQGYAAGQEGC